MWKCRPRKKKKVHKYVRNIKWPQVDPRGRKKKPATSMQYLPHKEGLQRLMTYGYHLQKPKAADFRTQRSSGRVIITLKKGRDTKNCIHYNFNCIIATIETFYKSFIILSISIIIRSRLITILELDC